MARGSESQGVAMNDPASPRQPSVPDDARVRPVVFVRRGFYLSLGVLGAAAAAAAVYTARGVLIWAVVALFLAVSLDPAVRLLIRWHLSRGTAVLVVIVVALGLG